MQIKLNRGPMKNKCMMLRDGESTVVIAEPPKINYFSGGDFYYDFYPTSPTLRRGTYYRSNVKLKDGTVVFEWMGWME